MFEVNMSFLPEHLVKYFKRAQCSYNYNTRNTIQITNVFILERRRKQRVLGLRPLNRGIDYKQTCKDAIS